MELNLRKARKLEAKIADAIAKTTLSSAIKVRILSSDEEREQELSRARSAFLAQIENRDALVKARFWIRKTIGQANATTGINDLISLREEALAYLSNSTASVDALNVRELRDLAQSKKNRLERGDSSRYDDGVTFAVSVANEEDIVSFKKKDLKFKKELEDLEDQLAQKNLGVKVTLPPIILELLKKNDLI